MSLIRRLAPYWAAALVGAAISWAVSADLSNAAPTSGAAVEDVRIPMVTPTGQSLTLQGRVYQQRNGARHPAVVLNHGAPRDAAQRRSPEYANLVNEAEWFQHQGYVVVQAKRRGYGTSDGDFVETSTSGSCQRRNYTRDGLISADDIQAAVNYARQLPSVDPSRIILAGVSAGGWGSLALASRQPEGVIALVNLAGGRGSAADLVNCDVPDLVRSAGEFGKTTKVPSIWLYAVNDLHVPPTVSQPMYEAFKASTASRSEYVALPAFGRDGHSMFGAAAAGKNWQPTVLRFLAQLKEARQ
ncbi:MAG: prolyl oligopeptidase family serine peptidase [Proteobacteria bacterium]|nr:prolyl oligopeptidase family serine peptidase [Pseudomonadota bacterium]